MNREALRVLVVEDNHDQADSLAIILRAWGYDVRVAYDGLEALSIVTQFAPNVILTDIGLPGMDGFQLAEKLRRLAETKNALLVAVTAYSDPVTRRRSTAAGIKRHFVKPLDLDAIKKVLAERSGGPPRPSLN
jgi:two-component system CheB/CheR fusion protein